MTENIVQMAKLTVKANVFTVRTEYCLRVWKTCGPLPLGAPGCPATLATVLACMGARSCRPLRNVSADKSRDLP